MRVAVCIFGEIRGTPDTWQRLYDNIIRPNNADVFINNVYYKKDFIEHLDIDDVERKYIAGYYANKGVYYTPPPELFEILSPKEYLLQARVAYSEEHLPSLQSRFSHVSHVPGQSSNRWEYHTLLSQNESRKWALRMRQQHEERTGIKYDMVILTRLDANTISPMDIRHLHPDHIYAKHSHGVHKIFEQLMFGSAEKMDILCNYFHCLNHLYSELCDDLHPFAMNEYYIAQFLLRCGIHVVHYNVPLDFEKQGNGLDRSEHAFIQSSVPSVEAVADYNTS